MRQLLVQGVLGVVVWVGRVGSRCRVWCLVIGFPLVAAGGAITVVCVGRG